MEEFCL